jgi:broad specificity phosphatase PhoE
VTRLYLVRHGRASAGWDTDPDPGLDDLGKQQSLDVGARLAPLGPLHVETSPLRRCQETAAPLLAAWRLPLMIEPRIAEIPSPEGVPMAERVEWLRAAMQGTWTELGPRYTAFRDGVVAAMRSRQRDSVLFSHFVAINAAIGAALGDDRLVIRSLDNCSVTVIDVAADGGLALVEGGHEADTLIR